MDNICAPEKDIVPELILYLHVQDFSFMSGVPRKSVRHDEEEHLLNKTVKHTLTFVYKFIHSIWLGYSPILFLNFVFVQPNNSSNVTITKKTMKNKTSLLVSHDSYQGTHPQTNLHNQISHTQPVLLRFSFRLYLPFSLSPQPKINKITKPN